MDLDSRVKLVSGNTMPIMGLGTWQLTHDTAKTISQALKLGYPMIDTSGDYGTQPGIGQGIKDSGVARKDFYLVTKVEETDDSYKATKQNLQELQLDYADLMLIHRPPKSGAGEELWEGLIKARKEGLTRDVGVSNYSTEQLERLIQASGVTPAVNQIEWSPYGFDLDMREFCGRHGIVIQAYSPLTRGDRLSEPTVETIADKYEVSPALVLIRWAIQMSVVPIVKANQEKHLKENLKVFDFELDHEDMAGLAQLNENYSALGSKPVYMKQ